MKKTILAVLMVLMVSTPCIAQEVETDGIFSIEGTAWESPVALTLFPNPRIGPFELRLGFSGGKVYRTFSADFPPTLTTKSFYVDMLAISIFMSVSQSSLSGQQIILGIMQPIGIGVMTYNVKLPTHPSPAEPITVIGLLTKTDDDWTPPEVE